MRFLTFIGSIVFLVFPFSYYSRTQTIGFVQLEESANLSFFFFSKMVGISFITVDNFMFVNFDWFNREGTYGEYFGDLWYLGLVSVGLALLALIISLFESSTGFKSDLILLGSIILLIIIRSLHLFSLNLSFYTSQNVAGISQLTYYEIPITFISVIILLVLQVLIVGKKNKKEK